MLVTIARFLDPVEAQVVRARLESEGIAASVAGYQHALADWTLLPALGGASLQVPATQATLALGILQDYRSGALEADLFQQHPATAPEVCPHCGSTSAMRLPSLRHRVRAVVLALGLGLPAPVQASERRCRDCGWRWRAADA